MPAHCAWRGSEEHVRHEHGGALHPSLMAMPQRPSSRSSEASTPEPRYPDAGSSAVPRRRPIGEVSAILRHVRQLHHLDAGCLTVERAGSLLRVLPAGWSLWAATAAGRPPEMLRVLLSPLTFSERVCGRGKA